MSFDPVIETKVDQLLLALEPGPGITEDDVAAVVPLLTWCFGAMPWIGSLPLKLQQQFSVIASTVQGDGPVTAKAFRSAMQEHYADHPPSQPLMHRVQGYIGSSLGDDADAYPEVLLTALVRLFGTDSPQPDADAGQAPPPVVEWK